MGVCPSGYPSVGNPAVTLCEMEAGIVNVWEGNIEDARPMSDAALSPEVEPLVFNATWRIVQNARRLGSEFDFYDVDVAEGDGGSLLLLLPVELSEDAVVPLVIMQVGPDFWEWSAEE